MSLLCLLSLALFFLSLSFSLFLSLSPFLSLDLRFFFVIFQILYCENQMFMLSDLFSRISETLVIVGYHLEFFFNRVVVCFFSLSC